MTIKNLSKSIANKGLGFNVREDLNFSDDGNRFRGFDYKGLPITTLRADDTTYLAIRVDYIEHTFTYEDWMQTDEYRLCDEFNGVGEIDLDKLIDNCEKVLAKVAELEETAKNEVVDMSQFEARRDEEIAMLSKFVDEAKASVEWWTLPDWKLRRASEYIKRIIQIIEELERMDINDMSQAEKRQRSQSLARCGYIREKADGFYITQLKSFMQ